MSRLDQILAQMPSMSDQQLQNMSVVQGPVGAAAQGMLKQRQTGVNAMMTPMAKEYKTDIPNTQLQAVQGAVPTATTPPTLMDLLQQQQASRPNMLGGEVQPRSMPGQTDPASFAAQDYAEPPAQPAIPSAPEPTPQGLPSNSLMMGGGPSFQAMPWAAEKPERRRVSGAAPSPDKKRGLAGLPQTYMQNTPYGDEYSHSMFPMEKRSLSEGMAPTAELPKNSLMLSPPMSGEKMPGDMVEPASKAGDFGQHQNAPDPTQPGHKVDPNDDPLRKERGMALMATGLGMLASNSRNGALGALGEGGLAGLRYYQQAKAQHQQGERYKQQDARDDRRLETDMAWRNQQSQLAREKMEMEREMFAAKAPLTQLEMDVKRSQIEENLAQAQRARRGPAGSSKDPEKGELEKEYLRARIEKTRRAEEGGSGATENQKFTQLRSILTDADRAVQAKLEGMRPTERAKADPDKMKADAIRDMGYDYNDIQAQLRSITGVKGASKPAAANSDPMGLFN